MAVGTRAAQRTWLRAMVGRQQDTALVNDALLDACLDDALLEINVMFGQVAISSFATVADQQAYTVVLPGTGVRLRRAFWPGACTLDEYKGYQNLWYPSSRVLDEQGHMAPPSYATLVNIYQQRTWLDKLTSGKAVIEAPDTVYLTPVPSVTGTNVYYSYSKPRFADVDEVTVDLERPYREFAKYLLHGVLAGGIGGTNDVQSDTGMRIKTKAPEHHLKMSERAYKRYQQMLPAISPMRSWW